MGAYYYLASQLPCLVYGQTPPMSSVAFKGLAKSLLETRDALLLDAVDLEPGGVKEGPGDDGPAYAEHAAPSGSDFIDRWRDWERVLRLNLARQRAQRLKREGDILVEPPIYPADAVTAVQAAMVVESPLEAELLLDKARWDAIEYLQGINYFDRNTIYAYLLKLLLLERRVAFQVEEGFTEYKSLYASILDGVSPVGEPK